MIDGDTVRGILDFWFGPPSSPDFGKGHAAWFMHDAAFDAEVRARWADLHERAAAFAYHHWRDHPLSAVALLLLLDQAPRNLFRGSARAFATDAYAREVCRHARERGFDKDLPAVMRLFLYLPLEHSEDLGDQETYIQLARGFDDPTYVDYGIMHRDIIARFGRFPHRNKALGRRTTRAEAAFLKQPNSSF